MSQVNKLFDYIQNRRKDGYSYRGTPVYDVSKSDIKKMKQIADSYGFPFEWLANLINFESAGTFNPSIENSLGYVGLIQFGNSAASFLGVSKDELKRMNFSKQLDYVDRYIFEVLKNKNVITDSSKTVGRNFTQTDLFMAIFYPAAVGKSNYVFPDSVQTANNGIKTPLDYTARAVKETSPFPLNEVPVSIDEYVKKFGSVSSSFSAKGNNWWILPTAIIIFGSLTALTVYYLQKNK